MGFLWLLIKTEFHTHIFVVRADFGADKTMLRFCLAFRIAGQSESNSDDELLSGYHLKVNTQYCYNIDSTLDMLTDVNR